MNCDCGKYHRRGYFCADHVAVAELVYNALGLDFTGFTHHDVALRYWLLYLHMCFKSSTPQSLQDAFDNLLRQERSGPNLPVDVPSSIPIVSPSVTKPAIDRLKNYDKQHINLTQVDGLFCSSHLPLCDDKDAIGLEQAFTKMFLDIQESTPSEFEAAFGTSLNNSVFPPNLERHISARERLKGLANTSYKLADRVGPDGVAKLEETFNEFHKWCSERLGTNED